VAEAPGIQIADGDLQAFRQRLQLAVETFTSTGNLTDL